MNTYDYILLLELTTQKLVNKKIINFKLMFIIFGFQI